jgi:itaconate CoA-transferase
MQPLKGITVVTLEHAIAAPFATRQLADLGARVIKIERPGVGDFARGYDQRVRGLASHFVWTNRSKESLTLDVKHPERRGPAAAADRREGRRGGAEPGAGRGRAAGPVLRSAEGRRKPDLIVCDISGYGDDPDAPGPTATRRPTTC